MIAVGTETGSIIEPPSYRNATVAAALAHDSPPAKEASSTGVVRHGPRFIIIIDNAIGRNAAQDGALAHSIFQNCTTSTMPRRRRARCEPGGSTRRAGSMVMRSRAPLPSRDLVALEIDILGAHHAIQPRQIDLQHLAIKKQRR